MKESGSFLLMIVFAFGGLMLVYLASPVVFGILKGIADISAGR